MTTKNLLILISGQTREFKSCIASHCKFINTFRNERLIHTDVEITITVLVNVWNESFSIFPKRYRSFIEDISTETVEKIVLPLRKLCNVVINIVDICGAEEYVTALGTAGVDDFAYVAYLNNKALEAIMKIENEVGHKFDYVLKIRPDLYILPVVPAEFFWTVLNTTPAAVALYGHTSPFNGPSSLASYVQYNDCFELFGRIAFAAYGQMLLTLNEGIVPVTPFLHTWVVAHMKLFGIDFLPIIGTIDFAIYRSTYSISRSTIPKAPNEMIKILRDIDKSWQTQIDDKSRDQFWLTLFDQRGIKYDLR